MKRDTIKSDNTQSNFLTRTWDARLKSPKYHTFRTGWASRFIGLGQWPWTWELPGSLKNADAQPPPPERLTGSGCSLGVGVLFCFVLFCFVLFCFVWGVCVCERERERARQRERENISFLFSVSVHFSGTKSKEYNCRSYGNYVLSFLRNCQTVFQSGCSILHSHQQSNFSTSLQSNFSTSLPAFDIVTIFYISFSHVCVVCYIILVLICISLMATDVEHFS